MAKERLLKIKEVAEVLGVSRQMVYKYFSPFGLQYVRLPSGGIRVRESTLRDFIDTLIPLKVPKSMEDLQ